MYQNIPKAVPQLQRFVREASGAVSQVVGSTKRPDPPRSLIIQPGSLEVLLTWNAPYKSGDVASYRIYRDNESNLVSSISDPNVRQARIALPASTPTAFYVSSVNALGRESVKVQVIGSAGVTATPSPALPPEYHLEPSGGKPSSGQQKRTL
jgi:hypothetical protein